MKKGINQRLAAALAVATLAAQSGAVLAGMVDETMVRAGSEEVRSVRVQFARSEMATPEGRAALQQRIEHAARAVCGPLGAREAGGLYMARRNHQCYSDAVDSALSQIEAGELASISG